MKIKRLPGIEDPPMLDGAIDADETFVLLVSKKPGIVIWGPNARTEKTAIRRWNKFVDDVIRASVEAQEVGGNG